MLWYWVSYAHWVFPGILSESQNLCCVIFFFPIEYVWNLSLYQALSEVMNLFWSHNCINNIVYQKLCNMADKVAGAKMAGGNATLNIAVLFHQYAENDENLLPHAEQEIEELYKEVTDCCAYVGETVFIPLPPFVKCLEMCIPVAVSFMFLSP